MDDGSRITPEDSKATILSAPSTFEPLLHFGSLRLRPIWVGMLLILVGAALFLFVFAPVGADATRSAATLCTLSVFVYYLMIVHRMIRVLDSQPGWSVEYTPAAAVWKHFIPLYGIYFLYRWPRDVESYIDWRLGTNSRAGLWTFLGILTGFCLRFFDSFVGWTVVMLSLYFLYVPLRRALGTAAPTDEPAPAYNGTLGLR